MDTEILFPLEIRGKIIACKTAEDRILLQEASLVAENFAESKNYTKAQLLNMSTVCSQYGFDLLQQVTADLAGRCDEDKPSEPRQ